jgi:hypothetical protein
VPLAAALPNADPCACRSIDRALAHVHARPDGRQQAAVGRSISSRLFSRPGRARASQGSETRAAPEQPRATSQAMDALRTAGALPIAGRTPCRLSVASGYLLARPQRASCVPAGLTNRACKQRERGCAKPHLT